MKSHFCFLIFTSIDKIPAGVGVRHGSALGLKVGSTVVLIVGSVVGFAVGFAGIEQLGVLV